MAKKVSKSSSLSDEMSEKNARYGTQSSGDIYDDSAPGSLNNIYDRAHQSPSQTVSNIAKHFAGHVIPASISKSMQDHMDRLKNMK